MTAKNMDIANTGDESKQSLLAGTKLMLNPNGSVVELFQTFNQKFFWGKLAHVEVRWSPQMTLCAGVCAYHRKPGYCSIRLSRPILSLRSKVDLIETLLHEMIHAYLFVTENNRDRDGHGPQFHRHMFRINREAGLNISVFHTFRKEVEFHQTHVWQCNGPCTGRPPYFGKVKRAKNRAPGPTDFWWPEHEEQCGGSFTKISEPEGYISNQTKKRPKESNELKGDVKRSKDIRSFFITTKDSSPTAGEKIGLNDTKNRTKKGKGSQNPPQSLPDCPIPTVPTLKTPVSTPVIEICDSDSDSSEEYFGVYFIRQMSARQEPDPATVKVRKPNLNAISKKKQGSLKNLIKIPNQSTLDSFCVRKHRDSCNSQKNNVLHRTSHKKMKQPSISSLLGKDSNGK